MRFVETNLRVPVVAGFFWSEDNGADICQAYCQVQYYAVKEAMHISLGWLP